LEGVSGDPANTSASEDGDLCTSISRVQSLASGPSKALTRPNFVFQAAVRASAVPRVLPLRVLAHDAPVEVAGLAVPQGALRPGEDARPADIGVHVWLTYRQAKSPQRDVVGNIGCADRAKAKPASQRRQRPEHEDPRSMTPRLLTRSRRAS
jgi:hypothetical protein